MILGPKVSLARSNKDLTLALGYVGSIDPLKAFHRFKSSLTRSRGSTGVVIITVSSGLEMDQILPKEIDHLMFYSPPREIPLRYSQDHCPTYDLIDSHLRSSMYGRTSLEVLFYSWEETTKISSALQSRESLISARSLLHENRSKKP